MSSSDPDRALRAAPRAHEAVLAISDLHIEVPRNRAYVDRLEASHPNDWLILAGDVSDVMADIEWALRTLASRFERVIWVPGNHELWTRPDDPVQLRGEDRYRYIVEFCRELGVSTPEDEYPVWAADGEPVCVAPLFTLYDYSFGRPPGITKEQNLARARLAGVVCSDEFLLSADPYASVEEWCRARVQQSRERLAQVSIETVLVNHFPLLEQLTGWLYYPEFAQWCGTKLTADWHRRYRAVAAVYGHLHIPGTRVIDGVSFHEVSLGYPRQRRKRGDTPPRVVLGDRPVTQDPDQRIAPVARSTPDV